MRIYKYVTSLLLFVVIMFIVTGKVLSEAQNAIDNAAFNETKNVKCWDFNEKSISYNKANVTKDTDLKNMDFSAVENEIKIESFLDTLFDDRICKYDSSSAFKKIYGGPVLKEINWDQDILLKGLGDLNNNFSAFSNDEIATDDLKDLIFRFEKDIIILNYDFVITGHIRRCQNISTGLYCKNIVIFGTALVNELSSIKNNLNTSSLDISEYITPRFKNELIRIMKTQIKFGDKCLEHQCELSKIMANYCNIFDNDDESLFLSQTKENINCNAVVSINEFNAIYLYLMTLLIILFVRSNFE